VLRVRRVFSLVLAEPKIVSSAVMVNDVYTSLFHRTKSVVARLQYFIMPMFVDQAQDINP